MSDFHHLKLKEKKYLIFEKFDEQQVQKKPEPAATHHLFIIDCSGSMWGELSTIRKDLYNKISTLLRSQDSLSILWFSGKGQCGVLVEDYNINSDVSLQNLKRLIDDQLTPRGLTAFCEPLDKSKEIIQEDMKRNGNKLYSLFFLTDGHDNRWSETQILDSVRNIAEYLSSATIVEYGYYCNRELLDKMATEVGGNHIFAKDFQDYEPYMERQFTQKMTAPREYVQLSNAATDGFAYSFDNDGNVISYIVNEDNEVFIDKNSIQTICYMSSMPPRMSEELRKEDFKMMYAAPNSFSDALRPIYAAMVAYSKKSDFNTISEILRVLGDAYFIVKKANTFGTQKINELQAEFAEAISNTDNMFRDGYNPDLEPAEDAYCVMDLIEDLMSSDENLFYPSLMRYKRMSRKAERIGNVVTDDQREQVDLLLSENKIDEAMKALQEIKDNTDGQVEFINEDKDKGFPITNLTWNNKRANLSIQVRYNGYVNLPKNDYGLEGKFETGIFRNYNIIKDGVIHTYVLPVSLSRETFDKLQSKMLLTPETYAPGRVYQLDFSSIPVINQKMVRESSAEELFKNHFKLMKLKARNSVFNYYKKKYLDGTSKSFVDKYGKEATDWLKSLGITSYGFNPPSKLTPTTEEILVNILEVKIDKLASLPSAKTAIEKVEAGKELTERESILAPYIKEFTDFYETIKDLSDEKQTDMIEDWIDTKSEMIRTKKRELENAISKAKFLTIVGKSWFNDLESREEKELVLEVDDHERKFMIKDEMATIKI